MCTETIYVYYNILVILGESNQLDLEGGMYIGGLGPMTFPLPPALWSAVLNVGYVGCMRDFVVNGKALDIAEYARQQDFSKYITGSLYFANRRLKGSLLRLELKAWQKNSSIDTSFRLHPTILSLSGNPVWLPALHELWPLLRGLEPVYLWLLSHQFCWTNLRKRYFRVKNFHKYCNNFFARID